MQVDTLKAALRELQQEIAALKATPAPVKTKTEKTDKV
jgi:hypothetical protein